VTTRSFHNAILAKLSPRDLDLVQGDLSPVALPLRRSMQKVGAKITEVYFVEHGIVSVVAVHVNGKRGKPAEVGLIGSEGITGIELILADDRSQHDVYVQVAGDGYRLPAATLKNAMAKSNTLQRTMLRLAASFLIQVTETALANGSATIDARLARWLLMADDRLPDDALPFTHEFLSLMLGVRRAGVTTAIQELTRAGLINSRRGRVSIVDRDGLIARAGGIYGRAHTELLRLMK
jgi:CRP-like cAMP-binding protein